MLVRSGSLGPAGTDVRFAITGRAGGVSAAPYDSLDLGDHVGDDPDAVTANRARLAAQLGLDRLAFMRQVHGRAVAEVTERDADDVPEADALVTTAPGVGLVVLVADCVPVLLAAPGDDGPVAAVAHAGRKGVQAGVVTATVAAMRDRGAHVEEARAVIGPAVCGACYEVPVELQAEVVAVAPAALATSRAGTPSLELRAAVLSELGAAGVDDVRVDRACTLEDVGFYSHRRDGVTGRFAGVVWIAS